MAVQNLPSLDAECRHLHVVQVGGQPQFFEVRGAVHLTLLAINVARILRSNLYLLQHRVAQVAQRFT